MQVYSGRLCPSATGARWATGSSALTGSQSRRLLGRQGPRLLIPPAFTRTPRCSLPDSGRARTAVTHAPPPRPRHTGREPNPRPARDGRIARHGPDEAAPIFPGSRIDLDAVGARHAPARRRPARAAASSSAASPSAWTASRCVGPDDARGRLRRPRRQPPARPGPARRPRPGAAHAHPRAAGATSCETAAQVADRVLLSDSGAARALGEHAPGAPDRGPAHGGPGRPPRGRPAGRRPGGRGRARRPARHRACAGVSVNFACLSGQLPPQELFRQAEDVLARGRRSLRRRAASLSLGGTCAVQHLDGYRPRFAHRDPLPAAALLYGYDFVSGRRASRASGARDPVLTAAVLECYRKPPAPEGRGGLDAFGHVPEVDLPAGGRVVRDARPGPARRGARRPQAAARPARTSPARPATSACSSRRSRWPRATRCASPSTTTRSCVPSPRRSSPSEFVRGGARRHPDRRRPEGRLDDTHADGRYVGRAAPAADPRPRPRWSASTRPRSTCSPRPACMFHSQRALDVLEAHGAIVDRETTVARIPASAVAARRSRPCRAASRSAAATPEFDLPIDGEHAYLTSDGCATMVREADGTVRPSVKQDVYEAARVVEGLRQPLGHLGPRLRPGQPRTRAASCTSSTPACAPRASTASSSASRTRPRLGRCIAHGRGRRRRGRELKARPTFSRHPLHGHAAASGAVRHGARLRARRRRHPDDALPDADPRRHGAGHAGRHGRRRRSRGPRRGHRRAARLSRAPRSSTPAGRRRSSCAPARTSPTSPRPCCCAPCRARWRAF